MRLFRWSSAVCIGLLLTSTAYAATVTGTVKGPDGTAFRGAFVQAQHAGTKITTSVLSDKKGWYRFENLPAGSYQLRVKAIGYQAQPRNGVTLAASQPMAQDFALATGTVRWAD